MQIKDFAKEYHIQTDTIRYYEKEGLLKPSRKENGYRHYDENCEKQIQFIIALKQIGFTLKEIKQLLIMESKPISMECNVLTVDFLDQKLEELEQKIQFYQQAVKTLQQVKDMINDGKFEENKGQVEHMMLQLFEKSLERNKT
ncbi:MerR family transcriptional regulator [Gracilibacillus oryzae]|uniref:MerR family transcriptional regulator n=1 Tax=Gracilibacillus oryzae TaxID=1672701 RepID=A0A7C8GU57_9BACI|nr:MerR family transcriptional regulator [Gracilibacillus oryzae]KAB8138157.1 MerR family transcriptional regulator [Gracilibacillus oryzae]